MFNMTYNLKDVSFINILDAHVIYIFKALFVDWRNLHSYTLTINIADE